MVGALLGLLLAALDQTIVSTAGPFIQKDLAIEPGLYVWITTSYLVASTVLVPIYVKEALGAGDAVATAIMGLFAIGVGIGAVSAAALSKKKSGLGFSAAGIAASGFACLAIFFLTPLAAAGGGQSISLLTESAAGLVLTFVFVFAAASMGSVATVQWPFSFTTLTEKT